jgi:nitrogenase molybdenum-iron protein alpha/beta subunit
MMNADATAPPRESDLSVRVTLPRSIGASLAINAVPDSFLLIDSPHCAFRRLAYIQGNHDLESTIALFPGTPRVTNTEISPLKVIKNRDAELEQELAALARHPNAGVVLIDAMAMAMITATDYGRLCEHAGQTTDKPILPVPHRSLNSDWLTAYSDVMEALADGLALSPAPGGDRPRIAVVGYLWDRNEGDHRGNLSELRRIADALDLDLAAVWLSGTPTSDLARIEGIDLLVSLPYGRRAARKLARRIGCDLLRAELPYGLSATLRFVLALGAATQRLDAALAFVERELFEVLPALKWLVPFALLHRRVGYLGDPHMYVGIREVARMVGCSLPFAGFTNLPRHGRDTAPDYGKLLHELDIPDDVRALMALDEPLPEPETTLSYPHARELENTLRSLGADQKLDLLVTNSFGYLTEGMGIVEVGFPAYHTHVLVDRPTIGMRGFLGLVERMANEVRDFEVRSANRRQRGND